MKTGDRQRATWPSKEELATILPRYATRLWNARNDATIVGTDIVEVRFEAVTYIPMHSQGSEFDSASSMLRDNGVTMMMTSGANALSVALDSVIAWKLLGEMDRKHGSLPDTITIPAAAPWEHQRPGLFGSLFKLRQIVTPEPVVITGPMQVARYELGRRVHDLVVRDAVKPAFGRYDTDLGRGMTLSMDRPMTIRRSRGGETRVHSQWLAPIRAAVETNEQDDPKWVALAERHKADSFDHFGYF